MGRIFSKLSRSAKTASVPRIPPELVDEVLDHLSDDMATLRTCSLVAKSWVHPSRRHIFNKVFFVAYDITRWNKTFPNPADSPARHVRDLSFSFIQPDVPIHFADRMPYFSNVQKLTLIGRVSVNPGFISALGRLPPSTRSVDVKFSKVPNANIVSVMQQLPNLDNLSLMSKEWGGPIPPGTGKLIQGKLSGKLRLRRKFAHPDLLNTLMEVPIGPQFAEVEIRDAWMDCFPATLELVRICQNTLTRLHFSALLLGQYCADHSFDFSGCAKIQEIELGAVYTSGSLHWVTMAFSTLNPRNTPSLSAVTLQLSVTLSLNAPCVVLGRGISHDLSRIGREMTRIQAEYTRKVDTVVRHDLAFGAVLDSQPIWRDLIGEDLPM